MSDAGAEALERAALKIRQACRTAWRLGMMSGWSGNASIRLGPGAFVATAAGSAKGALKRGDCLLVDGAGKVVAGSGKPSSEMALHLALYAALPSCSAILHTHPANLQALDLLLGAADAREFLRLPLFEARMWRPRLFMGPALAPGSRELARASAASIPRDAPLPCALWLPGHGLCALGADLDSCLHLGDELEHLARVQLKTL